MSKDTPVYIYCPQCTAPAVLISLPDKRYRCEACARVWRGVTGGYIQVAPSAYIDYSPEYHDDDERTDNRLFNADLDNGEMISWE